MITEEIVQLVIDCMAVIAPAAVAVCVGFILIDLFKGFIRGR